MYFCKKFPSLYIELVGNWGPVQVHAPFFEFRLPHTPLSAIGVKFTKALHFLDTEGKFALALSNESVIIKAKKIEHLERGVRCSPLRATAPGYEEGGYET